MALPASPRAPACAAATPARSASQQVGGARSSPSGTGGSAPAGSPARRVELTCGMLRLWLQRLTGLAALPSVAEAARPAVLLAALARLRADAGPDGSPRRAEASQRASLDADEQVFALAGAHTAAPRQPPGCTWRLYQQPMSWSVRWGTAARCCYVALCATCFRQCRKHACAEPAVAPELDRACHNTYLRSLPWCQGRHLRTFAYWHAQARWCAPRWPAPATWWPPCWPWSRPRSRSCCAACTRPTAWRTRAAARRGRRSRRAPRARRRARARLPRRTRQVGPRRAWQAPAGA